MTNPWMSNEEEQDRMFQVNKNLADVAWLVRETNGISQLDLYTVVKHEIDAEVFEACISKLLAIGFLHMEHEELHWSFGGERMILQ